MRSGGARIHTTCEIFGPKTKTNMASFKFQNVDQSEEPKPGETFTWRKG